MFLDWLLKTEEDNISYDELKNDVGTRQIKMVSVKMETCHMERILQATAAAVFAPYASMTTAVRKKYVVILRQ